ncbi:testis-expressed sequence 264 protein [Arapaima gigas]
MYGGKCGFALGSILSEEEAETPAELVRCYKQRGYKLATLPKVPLAVSTIVPCRTSLSLYLKRLRVYCHLRCYIQKLRTSPGSPAATLSLQEATGIIQSC